jgi:D-tyrosyl-tRNA(Tyr) deacylase
MIVLIQRVKSAKVSVDSREINKIGKGVLVFVGIEKNDNDKELEFISDKILNLRIFPDSDNKMNLSIIDIRGEILSISQFTLTARIKNGRRPSFSNAMEPEKAKLLYNKLLKNLSKSGISVKDGVFGAMMKIELVNDGPVTFIIDSKIKNYKK